MKIKFLICVGFFLSLNSMQYPNQPSYPEVSGVTRFKNASMQPLYTGSHTRGLGPMNTNKMDIPRPANMPTWLSPLGAQFNNPYDTSPTSPKSPSSPSRFRS